MAYSGRRVSNKKHAPTKPVMVFTAGEVERITGITFQTLINNDRRGRLPCLKVKGEGGKTNRIYNQGQLKRCLEYARFRGWESPDPDIRAWVQTAFEDGVLGEWQEPKKLKRRYHTAKEVRNDRRRKKRHARARRRHKKWLAKRFVQTPAPFDPYSRAREKYRFLFDPDLRTIHGYNVFVPTIQTGGLEGWKTFQDMMHNLRVIGEKVPGSRRSG